MLVEECLEEMKREGLTPDEQIYTSILAACSHSGSVEKGYKYFNTMQTEHGFIPNVEHCNGMIDLLCRAGHLAEAKEVLCTMEGLPDLPGQMSLFTACRLYGNWELAKYSFGEALDLEYDAMSNVMMDVS
jgi:pentatricopeptide repeat protein